MIKQKKDTKVPGSLTSTKSYDGEDVKKQLIADQSGKCYICERILTTDFVVEHLKSQKNFEELIQDWNNLFLSCSYCNGKKLEHYDDIVDPTKAEVENVIRQEIDFEHKRANFAPLETGESVENTIKLLNVIYNGTGRCRKQKEERFIEQVISTVNIFTKFVKDYLDNPSEENKEAVASELSIDKEALGFKYWIIKSNPLLEKTFVNEIVWNK